MMLLRNILLAAALFFAPAAFAQTANLATTDCSGTITSGGVSQSLLLNSPKAQGESDAKLTRGQAKAAKMENALA